MSVVYLPKRKLYPHLASVATFALAAVTFSSALQGSPVAVGLPTGNPQCSGTDSGGGSMITIPCGSQASALPANNGGTGVKLFFSDSGSVSSGGIPGSGFYQSNTTSFTLSASGAADTSWQPTALPVGYDFTIGTSGAAFAVDWTLTMSLSGYLNGNYEAVGDITNTSGQTFTGNGVLTGITYNGAATNETVQGVLTVDWSDYDSSGTLNTTIPSNSLDFNNAALPPDSTVPEPATLPLAVLSLTLGSVGFVWRQRRA